MSSISVVRKNRTHKAPTQKNFKTRLEKLKKSLKTLIKSAFLACHLFRSLITWKKHLLSQVLFQWNSFLRNEWNAPSERESLAGEPEIRLRRVGERILFHIDRREIFHNSRSELFHIRRSRIFHLQSPRFYDILITERWWGYEENNSNVCCYVDYGNSLFLC